jgi:uncharacterized protein DUF4440
MHPMSKNRPSLLEDKIAHEGSHMKQILLITIFLFVMLLGLETNLSVAQISNTETPTVSPQLYKEIAHMDMVLFDAFNTRNLEKLKTLFTPDLEFYQDNEGLASYSQTMNDFKNMFQQNNGIRRELVKGSLEIYPIKDYGAIEVGLHRFCHVENGKDECGSFKFVHVWRKQSGEWKISRVISFNH